MLNFINLLYSLVQFVKVDLFVAAPILKKLQHFFEAHVKQVVAGVGINLDL